MHLQTLALVAALGGSALANPHITKVYNYVAAFSIDGFHSSDVDKYVALRPASTIATLLKTAFIYTDAYTSGPSDSYPGVMNFVTGASPTTTGT